MAFKIAANYRISAVEIEVENGRSNGRTDLGCNQGPIRMAVWILGKGLHESSERRLIH